MNKGLKKGLGALAAVASLLALGPLAAANAAQPTRTRIDAFANDGTIAVESADGRTDISKHTINAYLLAPYTSAVATGDTLNEYAVSTGTGYADKVTTAVKAAFPDADKGADGWQVALGDATTTLDEANPMDWVARNLLDSDASPWAGGLRDFVTKLTASLKGNNAFPADAKTLTPTAGAPAKQTADGLTPGIYLILDTAIGSESAAPSLAVTTFGTVTKYSFAKDGQAQPAWSETAKYYPRTAVGMVKPGIYVPPRPSSPSGAPRPPRSRTTGPAPRRTSVTSSTTACRSAQSGPPATTPDAPSRPATA